MKPSHTERIKNKLFSNYQQSQKQQQVRKNSNHETQQRLYLQNRQAVESMSQRHSSLVANLELFNQSNLKVIESYTAINQAIESITSVHLPNGGSLQNNQSNFNNQLDSRSVLSRLQQFISSKHTKINEFLIQVETDVDKKLDIYCPVIERLLKQYREKNQQLEHYQKKVQFLKKGSMDSKDEKDRYERNLYKKQNVEKEFAPISKVLLDNFQSFQAEIEGFLTEAYPQVLLKVCEQTIRCAKSIIKIVYSPRNQYENEDQQQDFNRSSTRRGSMNSIRHHKSRKSSMRRSSIISELLSEGSEYEMQEGGGTDERLSQDEDSLADDQKMGIQERLSEYDDGTEDEEDLRKARVGDELIRHSLSPEDRGRTKLKSKESDFVGPSVLKLHQSEKTPAMRKSATIIKSNKSNHGHGNWQCRKKVHRRASIISSSNGGSIHYQQQSLSIQKQPWKIETVMRNLQRLITDHDKYRARGQKVIQLGSRNKAQKGKEQDSELEWSHWIPTQHIDSVGKCFRVLKNRYSEFDYDAAKKNLKYLQKIEQIKRQEQKQVMMKRRDIRNLNTNVASSPSPNQSQSQNTSTFFPSHQQKQSSIKIETPNKKKSQFDIAMNNNYMTKMGKQSQQEVSHSQHLKKQKDCQQKRGLKGNERPIHEESSGSRGVERPKKLSSSASSPNLIKKQQYQQQVHQPAAHYERYNKLMREEVLPDLDEDGDLQMKRKGSNEASFVPTLNSKKSNQGLEDEDTIFSKQSKPSNHHSNVWDLLNEVKMATKDSGSVEVGESRKVNYGSQSSKNHHSSNMKKENKSSADLLFGKEFLAISANFGTGKPLDSNKETKKYDEQDKKRIIEHLFATSGSGGSQKKSFAGSNKVPGNQQNRSQSKIYQHPFTTATKKFSTDSASGLSGNSSNKNDKDASTQQVSFKDFENFHTQI